MSNCVFVDGNAAHPDPWCSAHLRSAICCFRDADKAAWQALRERNAARAEVERLDNIRKGLLESLGDHARGRGTGLAEIGRLQAEVARLKAEKPRECECGQPWRPAIGLYGTTEETRCHGCVLRAMRLEPLDR